MNTFTPLPGITISHVSLPDTGCTAIVAPDSALCAVDVRGGGPGTRETDLLRPENTVQRVHAVMLSGGSAYGLATADGAMAELEAHGIGFEVLQNGPIVPIVPAAVIFDLLVGDPKHRPTAEHGRQAIRAALLAAKQDQPDQNPPHQNPPQQPHQAQQPHQNQPNHTSIGAGVAATAGVVRGGCGLAHQRVGEYSLWALMVANPVGSVVDPATGTLWADPGVHVDLDRFNALPKLGSKLNTTIGALITNAPVSVAQAKRLAMVGHDGIALAVRPAHSPFDGDTIFCLSTGDGAGVEVPVLVELCQHAGQVVAEAISAAVVGAKEWENPPATGYFPPPLSQLRPAHKDGFGLH